MKKLIFVAEKDDTDNRFVLWFVRRWAAAQSWNLHVRWRHRAIQAEAALHHLNRELARQKELRRLADDKLRQTQQALDAARLGNDSGQVRS